MPVSSDGVAERRRTPVRDGLGFPSSRFRRGRSAGENGILGRAGAVFSPFGIFCAFGTFDSYGTCGIFHPFGIFSIFRPFCTSAPRVGRTAAECAPRPVRPSSGGPILPHTAFLLRHARRHRQMMATADNAPAATARTRSRCATRTLRILLFPTTQPS